VRGGLARCFRAHEDLAAMSIEEPVAMSTQGGDDAP
jgi:hypothetical protein